MGVADVVRTVLAVRTYKTEPVPEESIRRIVEAAYLTASARNKQPWHFIVVDNPSMLAQLGQLSKTGPYVAGAPLAVLVAIVRGSKWAPSDASRAIQSMVLTAWDEGIGSNLVGASGADEIGELFGLPESLEVFAIVPFGYPVDTIGKGEKNRKPLGEVASRGRFGQPFELSS